MFISKLLTLNFTYAVSYVNSLTIILSVFSSIKVACCKMPVLVMNYELRLVNFDPQICFHVTRFYQMMYSQMSCVIYYFNLSRVESRMST